MMTEKKALGAQERSQRIYAASRASLPARPAMWQQLRNEGFQIVSSWIDEAGPGQTADLGELWQRIYREIQSADGLVLYVEADDFPLKGALIEVGMALGLGKPVHVAAPDLEFAAPSYRPIGSWIMHPNVVRFKNVRQACKAKFMSEAYAASLADSPSPTAPTDEERDFYALLRGICEDVIDWLGTLSYDNVTDHRNILDHRLTKELNGKLQKMYKHPLDDKVLRRTDELEHLLRSPSGTAAETKETK
jgi:hypothetical protein